MNVVLQLWLSLLYLSPPANPLPSSTFRTTAPSVQKTSSHGHHGDNVAISTWATVLWVISPRPSPHNGPLSNHLDSPSWLIFLSSFLAAQCKLKSILALRCEIDGGFWKNSDVLTVFLFGVIGVTLWWRKLGSLPLMIKKKKLIASVIFQFIDIWCSLRT